MVKNLPLHLPESELRSLFTRYGQVTDCRIMFKGERNRGFGFIGFKHTESATEAVKKMNGSFVGKHKLMVQYATGKGKKPGKDIYI